jgi:hypothetical protein
MRREGAVLIDVDVVLAVSCRPLEGMVAALTRLREIRPAPPARQRRRAAAIAGAVPARSPCRQPIPREFFDVS